MDNNKCVHDELANEGLVKKLRKFKEYLLNDDVPEWQQLIATAGFVMDVVNELKWKEHAEYHGTSERCVMEADDVFDEIMAAVNYELEKPYYKKLDSMWDDWNNNKTGKYAKINTMQEMLDIICDCLEIEYPGLIELEKKYFGLSLKSDENDDESQ